MALTSAVILNNGSPSSPYGKGVATVIEGFFPTSTPQVGQPVGNLSKNDLVEVVQVQAVTGSVGFIYDRDGSTFSSEGKGVVSILPMQGGNSTNHHVLLQVRVFRNT